THYEVTLVEGSGTISKAPLTITATGHDRVYDGTTKSDVDPEVTAGEVFFGDLLEAKQEFDSKNVGERTLKVTEYTIDDGNGGKNYEVTLVEGSGTISKAPLTITAAPDTRTYDGTTASSVRPDVELLG